MKIILQGQVPVNRTAVVRGKGKQKLRGTKAGRATEEVQCGARDGVPV